MKTRFPIVVSLVFLIGAGLWTLRSADAPNAPAPGARPGWEHLALPSEGTAITGNRELAKQINQLGRDGWEMFSVLNEQRDGTTIKTVFFFKRPLQ